MHPIDRFYAALNDHDLDALAASVHPDFEMIVPLKPNRGFTGRDQEVANIRYLFETCPDLAVEVLHRCIDGDEVWAESRATGSNLEMMSMVLWTIDPATDTIIRGRYYADAVDHQAPRIDDYMRGLPNG